MSEGRIRCRIRGAVIACAKHRRDFRQVVLIALYLVSLFLPAIVHRPGEDDLLGPSGTTWGFQCLIFLPFGLMFPCWYANPAFFAGLFYLSKGNRKIAFRCGVVATLLALQYGVWDFLWGDDNSLGPAYFTWLLSMIGLTFSAYLEAPKSSLAIRLFLTTASLIMVMLIFGEASRPIPVQEDRRILHDEDARKFIVSRMGRRDVQNEGKALPESATRFYAYDGGSWNGSIVYWSFECNTIEECWDAMKLLGPPRSEFSEWKPSRYAVVMKGPGYYTPNRSTPLWDVRTIERGVFYERVTHYKKQGSDEDDTGGPTQRSMDFYAIDFDRLRIYHHYESGGFPAEEYVEGQ